MAYSICTVYTSNATWVKDSHLYLLDIIIRSAGGAGSGSVGGGGGGIAVRKSVPASALPATASIIVGAGGGAGGDGGLSAFDTFLSCPPGLGGVNGGGAGGEFGQPYLQGGAGAPASHSGGWANAAPIYLLSGGGGGAGSGFTGTGVGGWSGQVPSDTSNPMFWQACQSGGGGSSGYPGGFPAGGGGAKSTGGGNGAAGVVTLIEYRWT